VSTKNHRALSDIIPTNNLFIALLTDDGKALTFPYNIDEKDTGDAPVIDANNLQSLTVEVLKTKKPLFLTEADLRDRYATGRNKLWGTAPKCWMGVPLMIRDKAIGVMALQDYNHGNAYSPKDVTFLESTAGQIAIAIERKRAEEALAQERFLMQALMNNVPDYVYFKDRDSRFIRINRAHAQSFGVSDPAQAVGKTDFDFFTGEHAQQAYEDEQAIIRTGQPMNKVERETRADRPDTWVSTTKLPLCGEEGDVIGTFGISRDITKLKQAETRMAERTAELDKVNKELIIANEKAEKARGAAEAANQAKSMFLSRMSHEIRTPMNSVIGFSDMLLDTEMSEEQVEFVRNITKSGEALLSLINEILDFSKIESGLLTFQNIDFDLEITAFDVCHLTQPRLGNKPVEVFCRVDDNLPAFIKSDPTRIRQVLLNLVSNAVKFTHEGEIELLVAVEEEEERRLKLHISVRDTGIGIPADKLETVFELFQQVDGSITRKYGGTGLGLAICKQIARLMRGEVWVESELGKGSTFHFTAWVDKSEKVFVKQPQVEALAGKKALLVDDNENNLNILSHVVHLAGMRPEAIRSGGEVLPALQKAIAAKDPFDICILDIQMPDMSGYEVSKQVRKQEDPLLANLKLLAFSSSVTKRIKMFKEAGFDGFLPKPIQRHTLITMLKRLLGEAGEEVETVTTKEKEVVITQHTLAEEAKHSVRILLAEDNPMNQKLAQFMLTKAGYQLEMANNGRETVEKYTAEPERYDLIFMDVHMPEMDGLEATKVLRNRGYAEIPIIAMTADAMKEDREKCLQSGMNDYMSKPIKREEVFTMIKKWVFKE
jgi:two-component system sensor histidine kinase/response regulator